MEITTNEEIKTAVVEYLKTFESGLKKAGEFSMEQAPLVVQEFLAWEFWGSVAVAVMCCLAIIVVGFLHKAGCEISDPSSETRVAVHVLSGFVWFILVGGLISEFIDALKVSVAPRLVILEKISELL